MTLKSFFLRVIAAAFALSANHAAAYEASLSVGHYEPFDGVVNGLYNTDALSLLARFGVPREDGLSWSSSLLYYDFESRVANLENDVRLFALTSGFRKSFRERDPSATFGMEPFFGASAGFASLFVKPENEATETSYSEKVSHGFASSWEVGANVTNLGIQSLDFEAKMTDLVIGRKLFGNINIGGRIFSLGVQYRFGETR